MSRPSPYVNDARIKHLEFIQNVISRLSTDSFLMKGWAVTVAGAIYGFAADHKSWPVAAIGLVPVIAFWFLDVYFVRKERQFRTLYDEVRVGRAAIPSFSMDVSLCASKSSHSPLNVARSATIWPFYGLLAAVGLALWLALALRHDAKPTHASRMTSAAMSFVRSGYGSLGGQMFPI